MTVTVKLFAGARDLVGAEEIQIDLPAGAHVADLKRALVVTEPRLARLIARSALARNLEYAEDHVLVSECDELALIPPVSGG